MQRFELLSIQRDQIRKLSINEIYYNLEEVYYKKNSYFPEKIDENSIKGIEPNLLTDPSGILINEEHSEYRYEPIECENGKCKKFTIRTKLEKEGDFIKNLETAKIKRPTNFRKPFFYIILHSFFHHLQKVYPKAFDFLVLLQQHRLKILLSYPGLVRKQMYKSIHHQPCLI